MPSAYIPPSGNSSRRASSTRPAGVRPFAWADVDSDDEEEQMFAELSEEEMTVAAQDEEHMLIPACLSSFNVSHDQLGNLKRRYDEHRSKFSLSYDTKV
jgi:hypothetical protein